MKEEQLEHSIVFMWCHRFILHFHELAQAIITMFKDLYNEYGNSTFLDNFFDNQISLKLVFVPLPKGLLIPHTAKESAKLF